VTPTSKPQILPDLVIKAMWIATENNGTCTPLGVWVTVANEGQAKSRTFRLKVNDLEQDIIDRLEVGQSQSFWAMGYVMGQNLAVADVNRQVVERDETNNQLQQYLPIPTPLPNCVPTDSPTPTPIATNTPALTPRPTVINGTTPTPISLYLAGEVLLQGRRDYRGSQIRLSESACSASPTGTVVATTEANGHFEVNLTLPNPPQCLYVQQTGYLWGQHGAPNGNLGQLTLPAGDMNQDGTIDIFDMSYIGLRYRGNDLTADLNQDGAVNIFDLSLVSGNYHKRAPVTNW